MTASEGSRGPSRFGPRDYFSLSVFGFGLAGLATSLGTIVLPIRVLDVAPEPLKNSYLGLLAFAGMVLAMIVQPVVGGISDRTTSRWGKRRPFLALGVPVACLLTLAIGAVPNYLSLFLVVLSLQASMNFAQGPYQAFVRDFVPEGRRGLGSAAKAFADVSGGVLLTATIGFALGRYQLANSLAWLWYSLATLAAVLFISMLATVLGVREDSSVAQGASPARARASAGAADKPSADFWWFLASRFCFVSAASAMQTFGLFFLQDMVKLPNPGEATGTLVLAVGAGMALAIFPAGVLSDRIGRKPLIVAAGVLAGAGAWLFLAARTFPHLLLIGWLVGVAVGVFLSANWALVTDQVSPGRIAQQMGLSNLATAGGSAFAKLSGLGVDRINALQPGLGYSYLLVACGLLFLLGALLVVKVRTPEPLRRFAQGERA